MPVNPWADAGPSTHTAAKTSIRQITGRAQAIRGTEAELTMVHAPVAVPAMPAAPAVLPELVPLPLRLQRLGVAAGAQLRAGPDLWFGRGGASFAMALIGGRAGK